MLMSFQEAACLVDDEDDVSCRQELLLVGDQDAGGSPQESADGLLKDVLPNLGIHSRQGIVQKIDVGCGVAGPGQSHSVLLAATQSDTLHRRLDFLHFLDCMGGANKCPWLQAH